MKRFKNYFTMLAIVGVLFAVSSCVDDKESDSVKGLRDAKASELKDRGAYQKALGDAEKVKADAQKLQAEAAKIQADGYKALNEAQAAYQNAQAEQIKALTEQQKEQAAVALEVAKENLAKTKAETALAIANLQLQAANQRLYLQIAEINAQKELAQAQRSLEQMYVDNETADAQKLRNLISDWNNEVYYLNQLNAQLTTLYTSLASTQFTLLEYTVADSAYFVNKYIAGVNVEIATAQNLIDGYNKAIKDYESYSLDPEKTLADLEKDYDNLLAKVKQLQADLKPAADKEAAAKTANEAAVKAYEAANKAYADAKGSQEVKSTYCYSTNWGPSADYYDGYDSAHQFPNGEWFYGSSTPGNGQYLYYGDPGASNKYGVVYMYTYLDGDGNNRYVFAAYDFGYNCYESPSWIGSLYSAEQYKAQLAVETIELDSYKTVVTTAQANLDKALLTVTAAADKYVLYKTTQTAKLADIETAKAEVKAAYTAYTAATGAAVAAATTRLTNALKPFDKTIATYNPDMNDQTYLGDLYAGDHGGVPAKLNLYSFVDSLSTTLNGGNTTVNTEIGNTGNIDLYSYYTTTNNSINGLVGYVQSTQNNLSYYQNKIDVLTKLAANTGDLSTLEAAIITAQNALAAPEKAYTDAVEANEKAKSEFAKGITALEKDAATIKDLKTKYYKVIGYETTILGDTLNIITTPYITKEELDAAIAVEKDLIVDQERVIANAQHKLQNILEYATDNNYYGQLVKDIIANLEKDIEYYQAQIAKKKADIAAQEGIVVYYKNAIDAMTAAAEE